MKPLNLFHSLPEELKRMVYDYENSLYRDMYKTLLFKDELIMKWWLYNKNSCIERVKGILRGMFFSGVRDWENEFGRISVETLDLTHWKYKPTYTNVDELMVYLHPPERGIVKYKILPKDATEYNCEFLRKTRIPKTFDGFLARRDALLIWDRRETLDSIEYHVLRNEHRDTFQICGLYNWNPKQRTSFLNHHDDLVLWTWI